MPTFVNDYTALISGRSWSGSDGAPTVLTYSFSNTAQDHLADVGYSQAYIDSFVEYTAAQEALTRQAFDAWAAVSGLTFIEVDAGEGDMEFGNFDFSQDPGNTFSGFAYYPGRDVYDYSSRDSEIGGDVFINTTRMNSMSYGLTLHEIGHAIGLEHPHDGEIQLNAPYDNGNYTVMSYNRGTVYGLGTFDVQAIQHLYGSATFTPSTTGELVSYVIDEAAFTVTQTWGDADTEIRGTSLHDDITAGAGDDRVGGFAGDDVLRGGDGEDTLIGGDGVDTLIGGFGDDRLIGGSSYDDNSAADWVSYQDHSSAVNIDLDINNGGVSYIQGSAFSLNVGTDELFGFTNVLGGSGSDRIEGSEANNTLRGGLGGDTMFGAGGEDSIFGQVGNDLIFGDEGNDLLFGEGGFDTIYGDFGSDTILGGNHADSLFGGLGDDSLLGEDGYDQLYGDEGNDTLFGGGVADRLYGGEGNDVLHGGTNIGFTVDGLFGEAGNDTLYGDAGFDLLDGGEGDDLLDGGNQADNLYGGAGNDTLLGGQGLDRLFGGDGEDHASGGTGNDGLFGQQGNDTLYGNDGGDRFFGGIGNDVIDGGSGDDTVYAGAGFDLIVGGIGDDLLYGGYNADIFVFADGHGADTIADFSATNGLEQIDLTGVSSLLSLGDVLNPGGAASQVGSDVLINTGGGNSILLQGVNLGDLDASDFIF
ncbi:MAG: matrixin family metalloprotease [Sulfitobacter sp.]